MMIVKIKSKEHAFTIPVPYVILRIVSGIITSNLVQRLVMDWLSNRNRHEVDNSGQVKVIDSGSTDSRRGGNPLVWSVLANPSTKQAIRQLIKQLRRCRGTVLVDVRTPDGTEVWIRL